MLLFFPVQGFGAQSLRQNITGSGVEYMAEEVLHPSAGQETEQKKEPRDLQSTSKVPYTPQKFQNFLKQRCQLGTSQQPSLRGHFTLKLTGGEMERQKQKEE